uniref:Uncharacterized protein n=1 Tax=Meloidogyne enterolobii TaxID=390850 RepID=A0A6V7VHZ4_MELEN|nr:unnamed protein product [Meloidogyne enterolobii]
MSTTPKLFKLFIFFVLIIKIVNCGICFGKPRVVENNNESSGHFDADGAFEEGDRIDLEERFGHGQVNFGGGNQVALNEENNSSTENSSEDNENSSNDCFSD